MKKYTIFILQNLRTVCIVRKIWDLVPIVPFDQMEWVLKYDNYLKPTLPPFDYHDKLYHEQPNGPLPW